MLCSGINERKSTREWIKNKKEKKKRKSDIGSDNKDMISRRQLPVN